MTSGKLMIFDCDGVLVDSEPLAAKAYVQVYAKHGMAITTDIIAQCIGMKQADIFTRIEALTGHAFPLEHAGDVWLETRAVFSENLQEMSGVRVFIENLDIDCCVASSSSIERINHSLGVTGLAGYFGDRIYSSSMVKHGKPAPDLFLHAAWKMKYQPSDCIVIEDSPFGIQAALAAGMIAIGFSGGGHASQSHVAAMRVAGADTIFKSYDAISRHLGALLR